MAQPNRILMEIYGQDIVGSTPTQAELEKNAQAEFVAQVLHESGYELEKLSNDELIDVATKLLGPDSELVKFASGAPPFEKKDDEDKDKKDKEKDGKKKDEESMEEKLAQADLAGQVMAHAFARELRTMPDEMLKTAGVGDVLKGALGSAKGAVGKAGAAVAGKAGKAADAAGKGLERLGKGVVGKVGRTGGAEAAMSPRTAKLIGGGTVAAGAGAAGGAAYGAKKLMEKDKEASSSIDVLAEKLARDLLTAEGIDFDAEVAKVAAAQETPPAANTVTEPSPAEKIASLVHQRAEELLNALGYTAAQE